MQEQIILPGVIDSLEDMAIFLAQAARHAGIDKRTAGKLHLAVDEMVTNIITHGYEEAGLSGEIVLKAEITPRALVITVEDSAIPFDPRTLATPSNLDQPLEERPPGGVGVYLMLKSVNEYLYEYVDGKNKSTFIVNRPVVAG